MLGLWRQREPVAYFGVGERVKPGGEPDRRPPHRSANQPVGLAGEHNAYHVAPSLVQTGLGKLAQGDGGAPGFPFRLEANQIRPLRRERQSVEQAHPGNERAGRMLKVGPSRPRARPVGRHTRDRQELPEPPATGLEGRTQGAKAKGHGPRNRHPYALVLRVVAAPWEPRGVADQLEEIGVAVARVREDLEKHALALDRHATGRWICPGRRGWPIVVEELVGTGQPENTPDRLGVGHDPEPTADLPQLFVVAD